MGDASGSGEYILDPLAVLASGAYRVSETDQAIITQFGDAVGAPVTEPGLHFKISFIQTANYFERRFLEWDGSPNQVPTRDKRFIAKGREEISREILARASGRTADLGIELLDLRTGFRNGFAEARRRRHGMRAGTWRQGTRDSRLRRIRESQEIQRPTLRVPRGP